MSIKEFAKAVNVSPHTVRYWIRTKRIKAKITKYGYEINEEELKKVKGE